jgi:hypothetical protein
VDLVALQDALGSYQTDKQLQNDAKAQARIATETKTTKLADLTALMKSDLKLSEVDTADDPQKLNEIGWSPRQQPQPVEAPGQPGNLRPVAEGQGILWLAWDRPASGGTVRNYIIERRCQSEGGGDFGPWTVIGSALNNEISLSDQPRTVQMEYRVKAANITGESMPSNIAAVVL